MYTLKFIIFIFQAYLNKAGVEVGEGEAIWWQDGEPFGEKEYQRQGKQAIDKNPGTF